MKKYYLDEDYLEIIIISLFAWGLYWLICLRFIF